MINENKIASMEAVGELPDFGNLLLREGGYPHLAATPINKENITWNDSDTVPNKKGVYVTKIKGQSTVEFRYWNSAFWGFGADSEQSAIAGKDMQSHFQDVEWREVQP